MFIIHEAVSREKFRDNPAEISWYLTDNLKENDPIKARAALNLVMRVQNVQTLARNAGLRRDALYRTFGGRIDPQLTRVLKLFGALDVEPRVAGAEGTEDMADRLCGALNDPDAVVALSKIVKLHNVTELAAELGIMRTTVYKTFGGTVDPTLGRVLNLFAVLRVRLEIVVAPPKVRAPRPKLGRPKKAIIESSK